LLGEEEDAEEKEEGVAESVANQEEKDGYLIPAPQREWNNPTMFLMNFLEKWINMMVKRIKSKMREPILWWRE
jgi:hypothetical protein